MKLHLQYHVRKEEMWVFSIKTRSEERLKCIIHFLYIFILFQTICEYHTSTNPPLLLRTIRRTIFSHLRKNPKAAQQVRDVIDANK